LPGPPADVSAWDLPADLYTAWEERVCIMHFDGRLPWREAEALALADVLLWAGPVAGNAEAKPDSAPAPAKVRQTAAEVQGSLFPAAERGPYL
jgi:hypothetical protein